MDEYVLCLLESEGTMNHDLVDIQMRCINSQEETIKVMQSIIDKQSELIAIQKEIIRTCEEIEKSYERELRDQVEMRQ